MARADQLLCFQIGDADTLSRMRKATRQSYGGGNNCGAGKINAWRERNNEGSQLTVFGGMLGGPCDVLATQFGVKASVIDSMPGAQGRIKAEWVRHVRLRVHLF